VYGSVILIIFPRGIKITESENTALLHVVADPEPWLMDAITEKARRRRNALIAEWLPRLSADPSVTELPADAASLCTLIMGRGDYMNRLQKDAAQSPPVPLTRHATAKFEGTSRLGLTVRRPDRIPGDATVTLFPDGIDLDDVDVDCIMAYTQDLADWVIGALLGQINRGWKKIIFQYYPIILADPAVATMPATEVELIRMIVSRPDYQRAEL